MIQATHEFTSFSFSILPESEMPVFVRVDYRKVWVVCPLAELITAITKKVQQNARLEIQFILHILRPALPGAGWVGWGPVASRRELRSHRDPK